MYSYESNSDETFKTKRDKRNLFDCTVLYCTTLLSSCSKDNKEEDTVEIELVNRVWKYSKINPDGFTLDIQTFKPVTKGFAVSYKETQNSFEKEGLKKAISHALKHYNIVGGWLNSENDCYYFDSVKVFEDSKLDEAFKFAKENEQMTIYDLTNQKEIVVSEYKLVKTITSRIVGSAQIAIYSSKIDQCASI